MSIHAGTRRAVVQAFGALAICTALLGGLSLIGPRPAALRVVAAALALGGVAAAALLVRWLLRRLADEAGNAAGAADRLAQAVAAAEAKEAARDELRREREAVARLAQDTARLAAAIAAGSAAARLDPAPHQGDLRRLAEAVNQALAAFAAPLRAAADAARSLARGEAPPRVTTPLAGDFAALRDDLNAAVDALGGLAEANAVLLRMTVNDHTTPVAGAYPGLFGELAANVNEVLVRERSTTEAVALIAQGDLSQLADLHAINGGRGRRCDNDELLPAFIGMMETVRGLVDEAKGLTAAAVAGDLGHRADPDRFQGEFR